MEIYRIIHKDRPNTLEASGRPSRWNSAGVFVTYSASSRALACLENIVHAGEISVEMFKTLVIYLPDNLKQEQYYISDLPENWSEPGPEGYAVCQPLGDKWATSLNSPILKVPSAIIRGEYNYLINPGHPNFKDITIIDVEDFFLDPRIKL